MLVNVILAVIQRKPRKSPEASVGRSYERVMLVLRL